jgi:hypothetical protein
MFKLDLSRSSMVERAAARVRTTSLEKSRANKAYKQHLKETKNPDALDGDLVFKKLRDELEIAKDNYDGAKLTFESVRAVPPL